MSSFKFEGQRIAYTEFGGGPAAVTPAGGAGGRRRARRDRHAR